MEAFKENFCSSLHGMLVEVALYKIIFEYFFDVPCFLKISEHIELSNDGRTAQHLRWDASCQDNMLCSEAQLVGDHFQFKIRVHNKIKSNLMIGWAPKSLRLNFPEYGQTGYFMDLQEPGRLWFSRQDQVKTTADVIDFNRNQNRGLNANEVIISRWNSKQGTISFQIEDCSEDILAFLQVPTNQYLVPAIIGWADKDTITLC